MATQALAFADENCPLSAAESFARAKAELDEAWGGVATLPQWNRFGDWTGLSCVAVEDAAAARMVLESISSCARAGRSAVEVFTATDEEAEAHSILDRLSSSDGVRRVLGNFFDGANTNLELLSATHSWGSTVCACDLPTVVGAQFS